MATVQPVTPSSLPALLIEFEKLLLLWADHPQQCDRKRLTRLNVSIEWTSTP